MNNILKATILSAVTVLMLSGCGTPQRTIESLKIKVSDQRKCEKTPNCVIRGLVTREWVEYRYDLTQDQLDYIFGENNDQ